MLGCRSMREIRLICCSFFEVCVGMVVGSMGCNRTGQLIWYRPRR